jgi:hypothetical protein
VISGYEGSKPRQVLASEADLSRMLARPDAAEASGEEGEPGGEPGDPAELERLSG